MKVILLVICLLWTSLSFVFAESHVRPDYLRNTPHNQGQLEINWQGKETFTFKICAFSGAHTGFVRGAAHASGDTFIFTDDQGGQLIFHLSTPGQITIVDQTKGQYGGIGVTFQGEYLHKEQITPEQSGNYFTKLRVLTPDEEKVFLNLLGEKYYQKFCHCAQLQLVEHNSQERVHTFAVRGLFSTSGCIILPTTKNGTITIHAALLNSSENNILYFSTHLEEEIPQAIQNWATRFPQRQFKIMDN